MAAPIVQAYSESLSQVFLWAAPVALVGFVLALFLREVPLRDIHNSAVDLGDGFGMPSTDTPRSAAFFTSAITGDKDAIAPHRR